MLVPKSFCSFFFVGFIWISHVCFGCASFEKSPSCVETQRRREQETLWKVLHGMSKLSIQISESSCGPYEITPWETHLGPLFKDGGNNISSNNLLYGALYTWDLIQVCRRRLKCRRTAHMELLLLEHVALMCGALTQWWVSGDLLPVWSRSQKQSLRLMGEMALKPEIDDSWGVHGYVQCTNLLNGFYMCLFSLVWQAECVNEVSIFSLSGKYLHEENHILQNPCTSMRPASQIPRLPFCFSVI